MTQPELKPRPLSKGISEEGSSTVGVSYEGS